MKNLLFIAGAAVSVYAIFLLSKKKCGCKKNGNGSGAKIVKMGSNGSSGNGKKQLYPDSAKKEFDTSWDTLFPSSRKALGSTALSPDTSDVFAVNKEF